MKASIKNGVLTLDIDLTVPTLSASGKTFLVATTHGAQASTVQVDGKPVIVSINAYIRK